MFNILLSFQLGRLVVIHPTFKIISNGFFVLSSVEVIFSFLIKMLMLNAVEIEMVFFYSFWNPKGRTFDYFFYTSHISHNFPHNLLLMSMS